MKKIIFILCLMMPLSLMAEDAFVQHVKDVLLEKNDVDPTDWYKKGDTAIAEVVLGSTRVLKVTVSQNDVNIKFTPLPEDSFNTEEMERYFNISSTHDCVFIFEPIVLTRDDLLKLKERRSIPWDEEPESPEPEPLDFMDIQNVAQPYNEVNGIVNGWNISVKRTKYKTLCSARK